MNNAVAGASLASIGSNADSGSYTFPHSVVDNSASLGTDGDLYCFQCGINDYYHNVPLGTADGVHPNEEGYLIYYVPKLIGIFNRTLPY